jgi:hypothetical protein
MSNCYVLYLLKLNHSAGIMYDLFLIVFHYWNIWKHKLKFAQRNDLLKLFGDCKPHITQNFKETVKDKSIHSWHISNVCSNLPRDFV